MSKGVKVLYFAPLFLKVALHSKAIEAIQYRHRQEFTAC